MYVASFVAARALFSTKQLDMLAQTGCIDKRSSTAKYASRDAVGSYNLFVLQVGPHGESVYPFYLPLVFRCLSPLPLNLVLFLSLSFSPEAHSHSLYKTIVRRSHSEAKNREKGNDCQLDDRKARFDEAR